MKTSQILKAEFLEHSFQHHDQCPIYTDGSKSFDGVGSCAVIGDDIVKKKLPSACSTFTAEINAILMAVKNIYYARSEAQNFIIYTDSSSVLCALQQLMPTHPLVQEVQDWLVLVHSRKRAKINFCWVPAHVNVEGNEKADKGAKEAIGELHPCNLNIPFGDFREMIHKYVMNKWQIRWSNLRTNQKLKGIKPLIKKWESSNHSNRRTSIIMTRLRIGHTHLTDSYRMSRGEERRPPYCQTCRCDLTVKHILIECALFNQVRRANSLQGRSMTEVLGEDCHTGRLIRFIKQIGFYFKF